MSHTTTTPVRSDTCETLPHSSPGASASSAADARPRDFDSPPPAKERRLAEASSRLGGEEVRTTTPTAGFAIHHLALSDGAEFKVYDVGGRHDLRGHWRIYYPKAHAIVFVLDAVDRRRLHEAAAACRQVVHDMRRL